MSYSEKDIEDMEAQMPILNHRRRHSTILVVLNDGETYSALEGCRLVFVSGPPDFADFDEEDVKEAYYQDFIEIRSLV